MVVRLHAVLLPLQWKLVLPWAESPSDQSTPPAIYGDDRIVAFAGLEDNSWTLVATAATGAAAGQLLWTTKLPLGSSLPSVIAVAGDLAVLELDDRVFAVHPGTGSILWNATSPCSLGNPRMVNSRDTYYAVYLICNELSGDSTVMALSPADGTATWTLSTSSLAAHLTPVRAAAAADGMLIYADTGSMITALDSTDGALLWRVDVGLLNSIAVTTSVTHLAVAADVLLVREFAAGLNFSIGPFSYLALQLNGTQPPSLLWAAGSPAERDRLPGGVTEASPVVAPALSEADDLFFYWAAAVVPASPPPQPPIAVAAQPAAAPPAVAPATSQEAPAPKPSSTSAMAVQWIEGDASISPVLNSSGTAAEGVAAETASADTSSVAPPPSSSQGEGDVALQMRQLLQAAASTPQDQPTASTADEIPASTISEVSRAVNLVVESAAPQAAPAPAPAPTGGAGNLTIASLPSDKAVQNGGVGVTPPEGVRTVPVLRARSISTGMEVWSLQLHPVSAPSAAAGAVAVVTPDGLQIIDSETGELRWPVDQRPIGIYPYAPTLVSRDAAAVKNCLDTLAPNSLCIYSRAQQAPALSQAPSAAGSQPGSNTTDSQQGNEGEGAADELGSVAGAGINTDVIVNSASGLQAGLPALVALACAALPLLLL